MGNQQFIQNVQHLPAPPPQQPSEQTQKTTKRQRSNKRPLLFSKVKLISKISKKKEDGIKMVNEYVLGQTIGQGLFGKVKKATRIENGVEKLYAMKILKKQLMAKQKIYYKDEQGVMRTKDGTELMEREIAVYKKIRHRNLVRLYEVMMSQSQDQDKVYLVLQLAENGQLIDWDDDQQIWKFTNQSRTEPLTEQQLRSIVRGCIKGLYHLHQNNIIHRDIKPQNILFSSDNTVKLADFGISQMKQQLKMNELKGTDFFMAPECFQKERDRTVDGKALDVWALGVTIFCFYYRRLPFCGDDLEVLIEEIKGKEVGFEMPLTEELKEMVKAMLEKDPEKRITIKEMVFNKWVNMNSPDLSSELKSEIVQVSESQMKASINYNVHKSNTQTRKPLKSPQSPNNPNPNTLSPEVARFTPKKVQEQQLGFDISIRIDLPQQKPQPQPQPQTPQKPEQTKTIKMLLLRQQQVIPKPAPVKQPWVKTYKPNYEKFCQYQADRLYQ